MTVDPKTSGQPNAGTQAAQESVNGQKNSAPVEVSAAVPCPICDATSGCQTAANGSVACLNFNDGRSVTIGKLDGLPYFVYKNAEVKAKREQRLIQKIEQALAVLIEPGSVVELRVPKAKTSSWPRPHTESGYFDSDHLKTMAQYALKYTGGAPGVYFTLNPVKPELLARRCNRAESADTTTNDNQIVTRRWLLLDIDPVRDAGISATDAEKLEASTIASRIREHLRGLDWPEPICSDSGNGYHLLYKIELPRDDEKIVERILKFLAQRFDNDKAKIDQMVFNPARICKIPGTMARKGDSTTDRPHRRCKILEMPEQLQPVSADLLRSLAGQ